jgi:foldase protein PrsA
MRHRTRLFELFLLALWPAAALGADPVNRIVLRVNDHIATLYDYELRKKDFIAEVNRRQIEADEKKRTLAQAGELVFKDMYDEMLLHSKADQLGIDITRQQVDRSLEQLRESYGIKGDEEFRTALAQSGLSEAKLREQLEVQLRMREIVGQEVQNKVKLEDDDLRRYYRKNAEEFRVPEQVQLREVVVLTEGTPGTDEREQMAAHLRQEVTGGKTLEEAIAPLQTLKKSSGLIDLGWVSKGDLDPALEAAAWKLAKGEVSAPVPGRGGLHLLQAVDRRESYVKPFSEVSEAIQDKESNRLFSEKYSGFMADLQRQSLIVADPPPEAAGFRRLLTVSTGPADELKALGVGVGAVKPEALPKAEKPAPAPLTGVTPATPVEPLATDPTAPVPPVTPPPG